MCRKIGNTWQTGGLVAAIAIRSTGPGGCKKPIQIKAQALRDPQVCGLSGSMSGGLSGFMNMAEETSDRDAPPLRPEWHAEDVRRAIAIAQEAGLASYRVEIAPDGTISIIVGEAAADPAD